MLRWGYTFFDKSNMATRELDRLRMGGGLVDGEDDSVAFFVQGVAGLEGAPLAGSRVIRSGPVEGRCHGGFPVGCS